MPGVAGLHRLLGGGWRTGPVIVAELARVALLYLLTMARQLKRSGIELKDGSDLLLTPGASKS